MGGSPPHSVCSWIVVLWRTEDFVALVLLFGKGVLLSPFGQTLLDPPRRDARVDHRVRASCKGPALGSARTTPPNEIPSHGRAEPPRQGGEGAGDSARGRLDDVARARARTGANRFIVDTVRTLRARTRARGGSTPALGARGRPDVERWGGGSVPVPSSHMPSRCVVVHKEVPEVDRGVLQRSPRRAGRSARAGCSRSRPSGGGAGRRQRRGVSHPAQRRGDRGPGHLRAAQGRGRRLHQSILLPFQISPCCLCTPVLVVLTSLIRRACHKPPPPPREGVLPVMRGRRTS